MRKLLLLTIGLICLPLLARADGFTTIGSRAAQNPTDIIDWSQLGPDFTVLSTPQLVTTFAGNEALVGVLSGGPFARVDEGTSWIGNFDYGENLVWTGGYGPFGIELLNPVGSVGFSIEDFALGDLFSVDVALYDTNDNFLGSEVFNNLQTNNPGFENGSAPFIGVGDQSGVNIGFIAIYTQDSTNPYYDNNFAIDDVSFTYAAVPEPCSLVLLGTGLLGLVGVRRKMRV